MNGRKVEYELEREGKVADVVEALDAWLGKSGKVLLALKVDGREVAIREGDAALEAPLAGVERIEAEAQDAQVLALETLDEGKAYLERLARLAPGLAAELPEAGGVPEETREKFEQLFEGTTYLESVFRSTARLFGESLDEVRIPSREGGREVSLERLLLRLGDLRDHGREGLASGRCEVLAGIVGAPLVTLLEDLTLATEGLIERIEASSALAAGRASVDELREEAERVLAELEGLPDRMERVATEIQAGSAGEGLADFARVAGVLEEGFRLVQRAERDLGLAASELSLGDGTVAGGGGDIADVLRELLDAFEKNDLVLIADLAEYEIPPIAERLSEALCHILAQTKKT